ncbi:MAG: flagellar hook-basal body complex protein FliE [Candidatus Dadabacteria bacterium]|nr:MAG: flagellar hook-basal body complex protein FliE [Candidatus Dadabacteria bacterium]
MSVGHINKIITPPVKIDPINQPVQGDQKTAEKGEVNFGQVLADAVKQIDSLQKEADDKITGLVLGEGVSTHTAMMALEKADIAFQLMNQVRSKIVRAYEEIMRTQV